MRGSRSWIAAAVTGLLAVGVAACGSSGSSKSSSGGGSSSAGSPQSLPLKAGENPAGQQLYGKKKGGTLTVLSNGDFEHLDPGEAYYALDYGVVQATDRPLFSYAPNSVSTLRPDLATEIPTVANGGITDGGKTITIHIHTGIHYSPPVNREVTSQDVAFALERGANDRREFAVDNQRLGLSVIEHEGDRGRIEARVERVEHRAAHRDCVVTFEHRGRVGEHDRDRIAAHKSPLG